MKNIVLISHGPLADGMKESLEMIAGAQDNVYTVSLLSDGDDIQFEKDLLEKMSMLNGKTMIIADLLGGTPCNVALKNYLHDENIEIITGLSLPLVLECITNSNCSGRELVEASKSALVDVKQKMLNLVNLEEDE